MLKRMKKDLTNQKFGRLTVVSFSHKTKNHHFVWKCKCDCGNYTNVLSTNLLNSGTKSCGCIVKLPFGDAAFNSVYRSYKNGAKRRSLEFAISKRYIKHLTKQNCYYCNSKPSMIKSKFDLNGDYIYNGIDRVDNSKGYIEDNVVSCCKICNEWKRARNKSDFINHCIKVAQTGVRNYN